MLLKDNPNFTKFLLNFLILNYLFQFLHFFISLRIAPSHQFDSIHFIINLSNIIKI